MNEKDRELMQMALDALKDVALCVQHNSCPPDGGNDWDEQIEALRERLSQPEPRPIAWLSKCYNDDNEQIGYTLWDRDVGEGCFPVYAIDMSEKHVHISDKDRHEWVDLTQEEIDEIYKETQDEFQFSQLLAYKLREKNSGWNGKGWA